MNLERCLVISFENFQLSRCELASQNDSGTDSGSTKFKYSDLKVGF